MAVESILRSPSKRTYKTAMAAYNASVSVDPMDSTASTEINQIDSNDQCDPNEPMMESIDPTPPTTPAEIATHAGIAMCQSLSKSLYDVIFYSPALPVDGGAQGTIGEHSNENEVEHGGEEKKNNHNNGLDSTIGGTNSKDIYHQFLNSPTQMEHSNDQHIQPNQIQQTGQIHQTRRTQQSQQTRQTRSTWLEQAMETTGVRTNVSSIRFGKKYGEEYGEEFVDARYLVWMGRVMLLGGLGGLGGLEGRLEGGLGGLEGSLRGVGDNPSLKDSESILHLLDQWQSAIIQLLDYPSNGQSSGDAGNSEEEEEVELPPMWQLLLQNANLSPHTLRQLFEMHIHDYEVLAEESHAEVGGEGDDVNGQQIREQIAFLSNFQWPSFLRNAVLQQLQTSNNVRDGSHSIHGNKRRKSSQYDPFSHSSLNGLLHSGEGESYAWWPLLGYIVTHAFLSLSNTSNSNNSGGSSSATSTASTPSTTIHQQMDNLQNNLITTLPTLMGIHDYDFDRKNLLLAGVAACVLDALGEAVVLGGLGLDGDESEESENGGSERKEGRSERLQDYDGMYSIFGAEVGQIVDLLLIKGILPALAKIVNSPLSSLVAEAADTLLSYSEVHHRLHHKQNEGDFNEFHDSHHLQHLMAKDAQSIIHLIDKGNPQLHKELTNRKFHKLPSADSNDNDDAVDVFDATHPIVVDVRARLLAGNMQHVSKICLTLEDCKGIDTQTKKRCWWMLLDKMQEEGVLLEEGWNVTDNHVSHNGNAIGSGIGSDIGTMNFGGSSIRKKGMGDRKGRVTLANISVGPIGCTSVLEYLHKLVVGFGESLATKFSDSSQQQSRQSLQSQQQMEAEEARDELLCIKDAVRRTVLKFLLPRPFTPAEALKRANEVSEACVIPMLEDVGWGGVSAMDVACRILSSKSYYQLREEQMLEDEGEYADGMSGGIPMEEEYGVPLQQLQQPQHPVDQEIGVEYTEEEVIAMDISREESNTPPISNRSPTKSKERREIMMEEEEDALEIVQPVQVVKASKEKLGMEEEVVEKSVEMSVEMSVEKGKQKESTLPKDEGSPAKSVQSIESINDDEEDEAKAPHQESAESADASEEDIEAHYYNPGTLPGNYSSNDDYSEEDAREASRHVATHGEYEEEEVEEEEMEILEEGGVDYADYEASGGHTNYPEVYESDQGSEEGEDVEDDEDEEDDEEEEDVEESDEDVVEILESSEEELEEDAESTEQKDEGEVLNDAVEDYLAKTGAGKSFVAAHEDMDEEEEEEEEEVEEVDEADEENEEDEVVDDEEQVEMKEKEEIEIDDEDEEEEEDVKEAAIAKEKETPSKPEEIDIVDDDEEENEELLKEASAKSDEESKAAKKLQEPVDAVDVDADVEIKEGAEEPATDETNKKEQPEDAIEVDVANEVEFIGEEKEEKIATATSQVDDVDAAAKESKEDNAMVEVVIPEARGGDVNVGLAKEEMSSAEDGDARKGDEIKPDSTTENIDKEKDANDEGEDIGEEEEKGEGGVSESVLKSTEGSALIDEAQKHKEEKEEGRGEKATVEVDHPMDVEKGEDIVIGEVEEEKVEADEVAHEAMEEDLQPPPPKSIEEDNTMDVEEAMEEDTLSAPQRPVDEDKPMEDIEDEDVVQSANMEEETDDTKTMDDSQEKSLASKSLESQDAASSDGGNLAREMTDTDDMNMADDEHESIDTEEDKRSLAEASQQGEVFDEVEEGPSFETSHTHDDVEDDAEEHINEPSVLVAAAMSSQRQGNHFMQSLTPNRPFEITGQRYKALMGNAADNQSFDDTSAALASTDANLSEYYDDNSQGAVEAVDSNVRVIARHHGHDLAIGQVLDAHADVYESGEESSPEVVKEADEIENGYIPSASEEEPIERKKEDDGNLADAEATDPEQESSRRRHTRDVRFEAVLETRFGDSTANNPVEAIPVEPATSQSIDDGYIPEEEEKVGTIPIKVKLHTNQSIDQGYLPEDGGMTEEEKIRRSSAPKVRASKPFTTQSIDDGYCPSAAETEEERVARPIKPTPVKPLATQSIDQGYVPEDGHTDGLTEEEREEKRRRRGSQSGYLADGGHTTPGDATEEEERQATPLRVEHNDEVLEATVEVGARQVDKQLDTIDPGYLPSAVEGTEGSEEEDNTTNRATVHVEVKVAKVQDSKQNDEAVASILVATALSSQQKVPAVQDTSAVDEGKGASSTSSVNADKKSGYDDTSAAVAPTDPNLSECNDSQDGDASDAIRKEPGIEVDMSNLEPSEGAAESAISKEVTEKEPPADSKMEVDDDDNEKMENVEESASAEAIVGENMDLDDDGKGDTKGEVEMNPLSLLAESASLEISASPAKTDQPEETDQKEGQDSSKKTFTKPTIDVDDDEDEDMKMNLAETPKMPETPHSEMSRLGDSDAASESEDENASANEDEDDSEDDDDEESVEKSETSNIRRSKRQTASPGVPTSIVTRGRKAPALPAVPEDKEAGEEAVVSLMTKGKRNADSMVDEGAPSPNKGDEEDIVEPTPSKKPRRSGRAKAAGETSDVEDQEDISVASSSVRRSKRKPKQEKDDGDESVSASSAGARRSTRSAKKKELPKPADDESVSAASTGARRTRRTAKKTEPEAPQEVGKDDESVSVTSKGTRRSTRNSKKKTTQTKNDDETSSVTSKGTRRSTRSAKKKEDEAPKEIFAHDEVPENKEKPANEDDESASAASTGARRRTRRAKKQDAEVPKEVGKDDESVSVASTGARRSKRASKKKEDDDSVSVTSTGARRSKRVAKSVEAPIPEESENDDESDSVASTGLKRSTRVLKKTATTPAGTGEESPVKTRRSTRSMKGKKDDSSTYKGTLRSSDLTTRSSHHYHHKKM